MSERVAATRRVALVGLDGSGKSTIMARLRADTEQRFNDFTCLTCPDFHDTADGPMHALSRTMRQFSTCCDQIGSAEMKALSMYLQMTLYGPVERFFLDTFTPRVLVCERHPLIETFVYAPLYVLLANTDWDGTAIEPAIRTAMDGLGASQFDDVVNWHAAESRRLGDSVTIWNRFADVAAAVQLDFPTAMAEFSRRYRTTLPDVVLWLDVPPEQAAQRCRERSARSERETHETPEFLAFLRTQYEKVREDVAQTFPQVRFRVIDTSDEAGLDDSLQACLTEGQLL
ncbi:hypothetical protein [Mycobacterium sp.]|uniref:hypothetical protein n=1 Tax=Mycobacterium sp. TaxID=1785 RepID=UPI003BA8F653